VSIQPFYDSNNKPSTDVSGFAKVLDYVAIMDYDVWTSSPGASGVVGPNAPLNDSCAPSSDHWGSAVSAVKAWSNAGMPISQIVLGVPSYGHSYNVNSSDAFVPGTKMLAQYPAFNNSNLPGDSWNGAGTFEFWALVSSGFLTPQGTAAPGIFYRFDSCSQTVRRPSTRYQ
jgi:chitinase